MNKKLIKKLERAALEIRKNLLNLCSIQTIHIGGDLSVADVMTVLWQYKMKYNPKEPRAENRDRFVLSKGHASAVTSFNQAAIGCFADSDVLREYATDNGRFSMHSCNLINPYIDVSTGSLGHGMPIACGMALGLRIKRNYYNRVYTVMGDGEQSEGSIWEAAMNAVHHKLGNLVAILDLNGLESDGRIDEITGLGDIASKYRTFGWKVYEIDGHDIEMILDTFNNLPSPKSECPQIIVCQTIKGKGVTFMENSIRWHAGKITLDESIKCIQELESNFKKRWNEK